MIDTNPEQSIAELVRKLIETRREGQYWDFKQEWYSNKASMLHDVLCMANNPNQCDSYLIIGVDDNCAITGTENDPRRRTTQMLNNFLRDKNFSGGARPELYVESIDIDNHRVDVIVIKNSDKTPFVLAEDYTDGDKTVHRNNVYSRTQDSNTPIDKTSDPIIVEKLYRKKFYMDSNPYKKFRHYLEDTDNWEQYDNIDGGFYYVHDTRMTIELTNKNDNNSYSDFLCKIWPSKATEYNTARLIYDGIPIKEIRHAGLDDYRIDVVEPNCEYIDVSKVSKSVLAYSKYYYIIKDSMLDRFNRFLLDKHYSYGQSEFMLKKLSNYIIYFKNDAEKIAFDKYLESDIESVYERINSTECPFTTEDGEWGQIDTDDYKSTLALKSLFSEWCTASISPWRQYRLSELGAIIGGGTPPTCDDSYFGGDIPWITPNDLSHYNKRYIARGERNITQKGLRSCSAKLLPAGTVLFSSRAPIGYVAIAENPLCTNQGFKNIVPFVNSDSLFLYYLLKALKNKIERYASGATFKEISGTMIGNISVLIPDSEKVRNNISHILSTIDTTAENVDLINNYIRRIVSHIYNYWFIQFDFPDENGRPYKSSSGKMVYNDQLKQEVPEGWEVKGLMTIADWTSGAQPPKSQHIDHPSNGYVRFIQNRDYSDDKNVRYIPESKANKLCNEYDIMVDKYGDAGRTRFGLKGAFNVALAKITPTIPNTQEYLRCYLSQQSIYRHLHESCMMSTRASLNAASLAQLSIVVPPQAILQKFENLGKKCIELVLVSKEQSKRLASLRDWLLPMLMNGQVEIRERKEASNDQV